MEWGLAAHWWGLTPFEFFDRDGMEQSFMVAVYRNNAQIDAVLDDERRKEASGREELKRNVPTRRTAKR